MMWRVIAELLELYYRLPWQLQLIISLPFLLVRVVWLLLNIAYTNGFVKTSKFIWSMAKGAYDNYQSKRRD